MYSTGIPEAVEFRRGSFESPPGKTLNIRNLGDAAKSQFEF